MDTLLDWNLVWIIINTIYKGLVIVPNKRISACRCPDVASAISLDCGGEMRQSSDLGLQLMSNVFNGVWIRRR